MEESNVERLIRQSMRDRSITAVGHAIDISQLPRDLRTARLNRDILSFRELELILSRLHGPDLYELVDAFARDAGLSLEPRASGITSGAARAIAHLVEEMTVERQQLALRVIQAFDG